jgi:hypothetical protein
MFDQARAIVQQHGRRCHRQCSATTGGEQVIADRCSVPALFGDPATDPGAPGAVGAEGLVDVAVVARQVVLGEQVRDKRAVRATSLTRDCDGSHASPPSTPSKLRPSLHGTYSWGNHSRAELRWRSNSRPTTGSSSVSSSIFPALGGLKLHRPVHHPKGRQMHQRSAGY